MLMMRKMYLSSSVFPINHIRLLLKKENGTQYKYSEGHISKTKPPQSREFFYAATGTVPVVMAGAAGHKKIPFEAVYP